MKKHVIMSISDGIVYILLWRILSDYIASVFALHVLCVDGLVVLSCIEITSIMFWMTFRSVKCGFLKLIGINIISIVVCAVLNFTSLIEGIGGIFPQRNLGDGDGLIILGCMIVYFGVSVLLRIILIAVHKSR